MQLKIHRYLYYQTKELVEQRTERQYLIKHSLEIVAFFIYIFRGLLAIITFVWENETFQSWRLDPFFYYIFVNYHKAFIFYSGIMIAPFIYGVSCIIAYNFQRTNLYSFRIIYDLIVLNIDQLRDCQFSKNKQLEILNHNYQISLIRLKQLPIVWHIPLIRPLLMISCWYWNKIRLEFSAEVIDQEKISHYKLETISISFKLRQKLAQFVSTLDVFFYFSHLFLSKIKYSIELN